MHKNKPLIPFSFFSLGLALLLISGCLKTRHAFDSRGVPQSLPEPMVGAGPQFGLNVHLSQYDDAELEENLSQINDLGIQTIKQPFYFQEPFDWQESDRLITAVSQHNLQLVPLLDGNPDDQFAPPASIAAYANWVGAFANRYQDVISAYIIWDEPNLTSHWGNQPVNPVAYGALLAAAAQAVRKNDATALIVAAPLAPTLETGPENLSETLFLKSLYETGGHDSFDIVAVKPYGFDSSAGDREVAENRLNFSRVILIRELMLAYEDGHKAIWAGNWGWNSLPEDWHGRDSIWGASSEALQAGQTIGAWQRAQTEWPWMGLMFLENWQPQAALDDPVWGFSIASRPASRAIKSALAQQPPNVAYPRLSSGPGGRHRPTLRRGAGNFRPSLGQTLVKTVRERRQIGSPSPFGAQTSA